MIRTMTILVPDEILAAAEMDTHKMAAWMTRDMAVKLFQEGKLTLAQAATFCGVNIYDFLDILADADIPVIAYEPADLERELSYFNQI